MQLGGCCGTKTNFAFALMSAKSYTCVEVCLRTISSIFILFFNSYSHENAILLTRDAILAVSLRKDLGLEWIKQFEGYSSIWLKDSLLLLDQDFHVSFFQVVNLLGPLICIVFNRLPYLY